jgi:hypothetical protein
MRDVDSGNGRMQIPRSRGALSGMLLVLLGLWGGLIPFIGPYVDFAYDPNTPWTWTPARGWLQVLPGAVTVLGGLMLMMSRNRATAMFGGWLAVMAGAWFVIGRLLATPLGLGDFGAPVPTSQAGLVALELTFYTGLGAAIVALGGMALGRLSVRSVRDIRYAQQSVDRYRPAEYREPIVGERVAAGEAATTAEPMDEYRSPGERRHRGLRDMFGSRRRPAPR